MDKSHGKEVNIGSAALSSQSKHKILLPIIQFLKTDYKLTKEDLISMFEGVEEIKVPLSVFSHDLSPLESLVKYLKENLNLRFKDIAINLNRDNRSIWHTYHEAKSKDMVSFTAKENDLLIPVSIFKNRNLSILENLVTYLKNELSVSVKKISSLINKNISTVWTSYNRAKAKKQNNNG